MDKFGSPARHGIAALSLLVALAVTGCGSRLSHEEIVTAGTSTVPAGPATADVPGAADVSGSPGAPATPDTAGSGTTTPVPGSGGSTAPGAGAAVAAGSTPGKVPPKGGGTAAATGPAKGTPVSIGNIGTYSGLVGAFIAGIPKALQAWAASINARGGLNGHPVKVVVGDDGGDPSRDNALTQKMIQQDKVIAFLANYMAFGNASETVAKLAAAAHVPLIGVDTVNPTNYTSTNVFPVASFYGDAAGGLIPEMVKKGANKLGILYCIEAPKLCGGIADTIKKGDRGATFPYDAPVSITAPSYTSQCIGMKNAGVNGAVMLVDGSSAIRALRDCKLVGVKFASVQVAGIVLSPADIKNAELDGVLVASGPAPGSLTEVPAIAAYQKAMAQYAPGLALDPNTAQAWAAAIVLEMAAKKLAADVRWQDLYAGLYTIQNSTLGGLSVPVTYREGKTPTVAPCGFQLVIQGGKLTAPAGAKRFCG